MPPDDERAHALGSVLPDPEAEPASPRPADEAGALDPEPIEDRDRIGDPQRHRVGRGIVRLVAAPVATMIREDGAEALARDGIGQRRRCMGSSQFGGLSRVDREGEAERWPS